MPTNDTDDKDSIVKMRIIGKPHWHFLVDPKKDIWTTIRAKAKRLDTVAAIKALQKFRERPNIEIKIEFAQLRQERV